MKIKHSLLLVFAFIIFAGCNPKSSIRNSGEYKPNYSTPSFIIDDNVHYRPTDEFEKSFLEVYTRHNAMAVLLVPMTSLDRGIAFAKAHPDRVIPYAAVEMDSPTILADVQKVYDMGFKGLGELFARFSDYNDPKYEPLWALAEKLGMSIAPHTGNLSNGLMAHLRPAGLADITAMHPGLIVHAAHFGNPWYEEAAEASNSGVIPFYGVHSQELGASYRVTFYFASR